MIAELVALEQQYMGIWKAKRAEIDRNSIWNQQMAMPTYNNGPLIVAMQSEYSRIENDFLRDVQNVKSTYINAWNVNVKASGVRLGLSADRLGQFLI